MARDDSDTVTGVIHMGEFENIPVDLDKKREEEEQDDQNRKLTPFSELATQIVNDEIANVSDIRSYLERGIKSQEDIEKEYRARELYITFLTKFIGTVETRVESIKEKDAE